MSYWPCRTRQTNNTLKNTGKRCIMHILWVFSICSRLFSFQPKYFWFWVNSRLTATTKTWNSQVLQAHLIALVSHFSRLSSVSYFTLNFTVSQRYNTTLPCHRVQHNHTGHWRHKRGTVKVKMNHQDPKTTSNYNPALLSWAVLGLIGHLSGAFVWFPDRYGVTLVQRLVPKSLALKENHLKTKNCSSI